MNKEYHSKTEYGIYFSAIMCSETTLFQVVCRDISQFLGKPVIKSPVFDFNFTDYYASEMGNNLKKQYVLFDYIGKTYELPKIKNSCMEIEKKYAYRNRRLANIDPGYITISKVVLASHKNAPHRICIHENIYADPVLILNKNKIFPHKYTFPDYKTQIAMDFFLECRRLFKDLMKNTIRKS